MSCSKSNDKNDLHCFSAGQKHNYDQINSELRKSTEIHASQCYQTTKTKVLIKCVNTEWILSLITGTVDEFQLVTSV